MIKQSVINALEPIIDEEQNEEANLDHNDHNTDVRISPRRWEQLLLYISSSLPPKDNKDANRLLDNIKINFRNYATGEYSGIMQKVVDAVAKLMHTKYQIATDTKSPVKEQRWQENLIHQLEQKIKLGEKRSYIPVVSGMPGIGKTSIMKNVADDLGLIYVVVDCSTLNKEDVIGIPLPDNSGKSLRFSKPKLLEIINKQIAENSNHVKNPSSGPYKYLIFFDELNRVSSAEIFNGLRQVLLEKKFGHGYNLPEGAIITAAINPHDLGTTELTKHLSDVTDIIPASSSIKAVKSFIDQQVIPNINVKVKETSEVVIGVFDAFLNKFKSKDVPHRDSNFYLDLGSEVYVSPREYVAIVTTAMRNVDRILKRTKNFIEAKPDVLDALYESFAGVLENIMIKHGANDKNFFNTLKVWFETSKETNKILDELTTIKSEKLQSLAQILPRFINDHKIHLYKDPEFINYLNSTDANKLSKDFSDFIMAYCGDAVKLRDAILKTSNPAKRLNLQKDEVEYLEHQITPIEYAMSEIVMACKYYNKIPGAVDALTTGGTGAFHSIISFGDTNNMEVVEQLARLRRKLSKYAAELDSQAGTK